MKRCMRMKRRIVEKAKKEEEPVCRSANRKEKKRMDFRYDTQLLIEGENLDEDAIND